ncbi:hypothetical protein F2P56_034203 [Juglans regia]|uniref:Integrase catalytic domain-containing protein n=2 Tax=Juglans regia TaxID=51240 RepID=A0A833T9F1_JUGRE|nr:uncharacterized protein LOC108991642 [Juglans regia]KAF5445130.1 hypothetical protein F2P56_034203 [Juglans regia]
MAKLKFKSTNNEAEYEAFIARLSVAEALGATEVEVKADSKVVINQVWGAYAVRGDSLKKYLNQVWEGCDRFSHFYIIQIPREDNSVADRLARAASGMDESILPWEVENKVFEVSGIRIPKSIILVNGKQFDSEHYQAWCAELRIQVRYSSPRHPQVNGQMEAMNKALLGILKKKLTDSEAVPPVEAGLPTYLTRHFDPLENNKVLEKYLDLLDEEREEVEVQKILNKRRAKCCFNKGVRPKAFKAGDLVLKEAGVTTKEEEKMGSHWEGPYIVIASQRPRSYCRKAEQGKKLHHPWNVEHLRKCSLDHLLLVAKDNNE